MKAKFSKSQEAHSSAVLAVFNICAKNNMRPMTDEFKNIVIGGKKYLVTTNTTDNARGARHFFAWRQVQDDKESGVDGIIVYHTKTKSCVMFNTVSLFCEEVEKFKRWKKFTKMVTDENGEQVEKTTNVPYYLSDYKQMCQKYGFLTLPSDFAKMDSLVNGTRRW